MCSTCTPTLRCEYVAATPARALEICRALEAAFPVVRSRNAHNLGVIAEGAGGGGGGGENGGNAAGERFAHRTFEIVFTEAYDRVSLVCEARVVLQGYAWWGGASLTGP